MKPSPKGIIAFAVAFFLTAFLITNAATVSTFDSWITTNTAATSTAKGNVQVNKNFWVNGTSTLATTTTSVLNGVIIIDGIRYPQTCTGINKAIALAATGTTIQLPAAIYPCSSAISFLGKSIRLIGAGATSTRIRADFTGSGIIYDYYGPDTDPAYRANIEVSGITFDANYQSLTSGIQFGSADNLYIHDNTIINVKDIWGVLIGGIGGTLGSETAENYDDSASHNLRFINNEMASSTFNTLEGFLCVNCRDFQISHNYFHHLRQGPAALALYVGSTRGSVHNNIFASSTIRDFYSSGADHFNYSYNISSPASSTVVTAHGIQIFNTTDAIIEGNTIIGQNDGASGSGGILIYDYAGSLDGHNTIQWATTTNITIRGNDFKNGYAGVAMNKVSGTDKHYEKHNIHIEDNTFTNLLYSPVLIGAGQYQDYPMTNIYITGNKEYPVSKLFSVGQYTITGSTTRQDLIRDFYISNNSATTTAAGGSSSGVYVDGASYGEIWNNHVRGTGKGGWADVEVSANTSNMITSKLTTSGLDLSTGCFSVASTCITFSNTLAGGGTATTTFYNGGVLFSDGTKLTQAAGSGIGFLQWDNTNTRLGVGTSTPDYSLTVQKFGNGGIHNLLHIGDDSTNAGGIRALIENRWTGNERTNASLLIQRNTAAPIFIVTGAGNVGVATDTPGTLFSIQGITNFTTATSTFYSTGGINLAAGCFAIGSTCLSLTNLTGILPIANGGTNSSATPVNNSIMFFNGTGIVGTSSNPLYVSALVATSGALASTFIGGLVSSASTTIGVGGQATGLTISGGATTTGSNYIVGGLGIGNVNTTAGTIQALTVTGINPPSSGTTISGMTRLKTSNGVSLDTGIYPNSPFGAWMQLNASSDQSVHYPLVLQPVGNNVGIGTSSPGTIFSVNGVANFHSATSTFYSTGGISLTGGGCFAIGGTCVGAGSGAAFAWTPNTNYGAQTNSTSTPIWFTQGLQASSTSYFVNAVHTSSTTLQDFTGQRATTTEATTTSLAVTGTLKVGGSSALLLATNGFVSFYGGASCTNQVITALNALGSATCTTLNSNYLDMTAAYTWTGAHVFTSSSVVIPNGSNPTVDVLGKVALDTTANQFLFATSTSYPAVVQPYYKIGFSVSTSSWVGTTTIFLGPADAAETFVSAQCETDAGTLNVSVKDGSSNRMDLLNASTTIGTFTFSTTTTNRAYTAGESRRVDVGTPASSPTNIGCTFKYVYDRQ